MGLINLKTDLKSLKYGYDRPGGGSSNQPYIVTPIPDGYTSNGPDFLLRQGSLRASITDVERLTKFFADTTSVRGLLFTAKQELLNGVSSALTNPNVTRNIGAWVQKIGSTPSPIATAGAPTSGANNNTTVKTTTNAGGQINKSGATSYPANLGQPLNRRPFP